MKTYKFLRGLLKASALTTVMFIMQACYGAPYQDRDMPDPDQMEMSDEEVEPEVPVNDTLTQTEVL